MVVLIWCLTALLLLTGLAGCIVPMLPGTTLILTGVVLHKLLPPDQFPWFAVGIVAVVWPASVLATVARVACACGMIALFLAASLGGYALAD